MSSIKRLFKRQSSKIFPAKSSASSSPSSSTKKTSKKTIDESCSAIGQLHDTEEMLHKRQDYLEQRLSVEMATAKEHAGDGNKRTALMALRRGKQLKSQLAQVDGTLCTVEEQRGLLESASTNLAIVDVMQQSASQLKNVHRSIDVDDVHDLMAELREQSDYSREISAALSSPICDDDEGEEELMAELLKLQEEDDEPPSHLYSMGQTMSSMSITSPSRGRSTVTPTPSQASNNEHRRPRFMRAIDAKEESWLLERS